jgi:hypothetical protein
MLLVIKRHSSLRFKSTPYSTTRFNKEHLRPNRYLNPPCGSFIQSRVHLLCVSVVSTRSEEPDGCLRVFFAKSRNMILTF